MRGRRNTNLSISSNSSTGSAAPPAAHDHRNEKAYSSPPVTPTLPVPVTKSRATTGNSKRVAVAKILLSILVVLALWKWLFLGYSCWPSLGTTQSTGQGVASLAEPEALQVQDGSGRSKWTVAIPHNSTFPLLPSQYQSICKQGDEVRNELEGEARSFGLRKWRQKGSYYATDRHFIDIAHAERVGALPPTSEPAAEDTCSSSLTFVMETTDASFGKSILMLWLSYGLAKKEGRAFFVDDTRWPYGKYTSYFPPLPNQGCSPPPHHYKVPCPHQAKHLAVSAATAKWTFGEAFEQEFEQVRKQGVHNYRQIYDMMRAGYEDLFELVGDDKGYAETRIAKLKEEAAAHHGSVVGMQVRRGDMHPSEYQFSRDYLPLSRYAMGARTLFRKLLGGNLPRTPGNDADEISQVVEYVHSPLLLASDDPDIIDSPELAQATTPFTIQKAQERILLATKSALDKTSPVQPIRAPGSAYVKHVDENTGWEGGFFSALFFSLGATKAPSGTLQRFNDLSAHTSGPVPEQAMRMRELVARAYLLDLAVLGQSDGVVCAVSSAGCRMLGVMMGWEAVADGRWMNVDDGRVWSWDGRR